MHALKVLKYLTTTGSYVSARLVVFAVDHPHPDPAHVMRVYRRHILSIKRKRGSARALLHYQQFVQTYLHCKRILTRQAVRQ